MAGPNELHAILHRTRAVEDEIGATRARIDGLLGVGPARSLLGGRWRDLWVAEVQRELPPLNPDAAHEALVEAMHQETGLVGAVRRRGSELEWKPFFISSGGEDVEVRLEGDCDAPTLRMRGRPGRAEHRAMLAIGVIMVTLLAAAGGIVADLSRLGVLSGVLVAAMLFAAFGVAVARRRTQRGLSAMARRVGDAVTPTSPRVRVRARAEAADEELEAAHHEAQPAREARRGVP